MNALIQKLMENPKKAWGALGVSAFLTGLGGYEFMEWRKQCRLDHEEFRYLQFCVENNVQYKPGDLRRE